MGLDPFSFGDALVAVLAQRLARRLCLVCRQRHALDEEQYKRMARHCGAHNLREKLRVSGRGDGSGSSAA